MSKTVYFRAFEEEDASLIYNWMNDDDLKSMSIGLNRRMCKEETLEWVKARMHHNPYQVWWAICSKETNEMIGYIYLVDIHYINRTADYGGILIGNPNYHNGIAWIESYLFIMEYVFERLNLNRLSDAAIVNHRQSITIGKVMGFQIEGIKKQAVFKNGCYYDVAMMALLKDTYVRYKNDGEYEFKSILRRFSKLSKE
ncbi:MAG: GNAT family N-acetyltransferase [Parabacteroides sp.]|nr:GNAT family N-acetyltransferase [Parabacteroides sp.]